MTDPWVLGGVMGAALAAVLWRCRSVTPSGAVAGCALTTVFLGAGGWGAFSAFVLLVLGGTVVTRLGRARKPGHGRRRDAGQALANAGPAAVLLLVVPAAPGAIAVAAALGAAWSDTASSEVGLLAQRRPRMLLFGPAVEPGRDGGMTLLGTAAGIVAAVTAAVVAMAFGDSSFLVPVMVGAVCGNLLDSILGATVESRICCYGNEIVNALASASGGCVAWLLVGGA
ncbi:MAG: DUF92 domain-containing protein [Planctomycetes bacterium]|nr:DUF92 domain-containing protein [Planctomycetota bacterium]